MVPWFMIRPARKLCNYRPRLLITIRKKRGIERLPFLPKNKARVFIMTSEFSFSPDQIKSADPSADILVLFSRCVRKANINSKKSYAMALNIHRLMDRHLDSITDFLIELNAKYLAIKSLQNHLCQRMKVYSQQRCPTSSKLKRK